MTLTFCEYCSKEIKGDIITRQKPNDRSRNYHFNCFFEVIDLIYSSIES